MNLLLFIKIIPFIIGLTVSAVILINSRLLSSNGKIIPIVNQSEQTKGVEIGGMAIFPILLIAICLSLGIPHYLGLEELSVDEVLPSTLRIMQVIVGCAILYIVGLKSDMNGTSTFVKFSAFLITACMFPASDLWLEHMNGLFGIDTLPAYIGMPATKYLLCS